MTTTSPLRRLAEARPHVADHTADVVGAPERDALLTSILATEAAAFAPAPTTRRPRLRLRLRLATALAVPALAGIAVVALVWAGTPSADRPPPVDDPGTTAAPVTLDKVRLAVAAAEDLILHMKSDYANGVLWEAWHDPVGRASRTTSLTVDGAPIYDHELRGSPDDTTTVRVVSHNDRAWWTYVTPPERGGAHVAVGLSPADIRSQLADGTMEEIGPETLDNRAVLHLRWIPHSKPGFVTVPGDMWVDAGTYLPIRSVNHWGVEGEKTTRSDYEWLPRSADTLAKLTAAIPPGFVPRAGAPEAPSGTQGLG